MPFEQPDVPKVQPVTQEGPKRAIHSVYVRVALYGIFPMAAAAGLGTFDQEAGTFTISIEQLATAAGIGFSLALNVLSKWGTK